MRMNRSRTPMCFCVRRKEEVTVTNDERSVMIGCAKGALVSVLAGKNHARIPANNKEQRHETERHEHDTHRLGGDRRGSEQG